MGFVGDEACILIILLVKTKINNQYEISYRLFQPLDHPLYKYDYSVDTLVTSSKLAKILICGSTISFMCLFRRVVRTQMLALAVHFYSRLKWLSSTTGTTILWRHPTQTTPAPILASLGTQ